MQVHAVPDSERAHSSTGRRLPWAYEYADDTSRRLPEEKGPFGRPRKRGTSRSKTATPARKEDQAKLDNLRVIDDIFAREKTQQESKRKPSTSSLPISASAPNLTESTGLSGSIFQGSASANLVVKEPTEVIISGYGHDVQWAAIDYYERVSDGIIYEGYDRQPPNAKFGFGASGQNAASFQSLSKGSVRKINQYVGGEHWIKVTFDSPEAAERACHYSPHNIQGFLVSAQRYVGRGPNEDVAVRSLAGSQGTSQTTSPNAASSTTMPFGTSSTTLSSATATHSAPSQMPPRLGSEPIFRTSGAFPLEDEDATVIAPQQTQSLTQPQPSTATTSASTSTLQSPQTNGRSTLRIRGAKPAVLLSPEKAFLPAASRWQQTFGSWPIIGWIVGTNHGIIGDQVPRKEDGSFDSTNASFYWKAWYTLDRCFGSDFCGVRDAEYEE